MSYDIVIYLESWHMHECHPSSVSVDLKLHTELKGSIQSQHFHYL